MARAAVEWVPSDDRGRSVSHWGRHDFAWWRRARGGEHPPVAFLVVHRFDAAGQRAKRIDFKATELRQAKAAAKAWVEEGGMSATVQGQVEIPFEGVFPVQDLGEYRTKEDRGVHIWDVGPDGMPFSRKGPFPDVDEAYREARRLAESTTRDQVVTFGSDPTARSFEILKAYKARSGEVYFTSELAQVGRRLGEYRGNGKRTILGTMKTWLEKGHLYAHDAVRIERSGEQAWVVDSQDGFGLKLFPSRAHAKQAIDAAVERLQ